MISPSNIQPLTPQGGGDATPLLFSLATYIYETIEKENRIEVASLIQEMRAREGTWGLTGNFVKKVFIPKGKEYLIIPDFYLGDIPLTTEETLYRAMVKELKETFKKKRILGYIKGQGAVIPPIYAEEWQGYGAKVDIRACYYTIYSNFGLDATVMYEIQGKTIQVKAVGLGFINKHNSEIVAKIGDYKILRNTLYGFTRAKNKTWIRWIEGGWEAKQAEGLGALYNPNLYELACVLTNAVFQDLRRAGVRVRYWHTDGGIVEAEDKDKAIEIITSWGFEVKADEEGYAEIRGVGSYAVGKKHTKPYAMGYGGGRYENTYEVLGLDKAKVKKILEGRIRL